MAILETPNDLWEYVSSDIFFKLSASAHIRQEVSTTADFHHKHNMLRCLEWLEQSHNILMLNSAQDIVLLHNFFLWSLFGHKLFVDRLQRDKLGWQSVNCQVHFTKCALAHNFSNFVVIALGLGRVANLQERKFNFLLQSVNYLCSRSQCIWGGGLLGV